MSTSYGPSALATPSNAITVARLLVSPLLFALIASPGGSWAAFALWSVLCLTDGVDGYLARRQGTTRSGAFLDPLADKVLVLGAMFALVANGVFWWVPVAVIAARELTVSLYRSYAGRRGVSVPARGWAKIKTVVQEFAVAWALFPPTAEHVDWLPRAFLLVAVVLTVVTGAQYLLDAHKLAAGVAARPTDGDHAV